MKVYKAKDGNLRFLRNKRLGIIGYGSQGRAQAININRSGITPLIGLPSRSSSRKQAKADGFTVTTARRLAARADIIIVLAPDHLQGEIFADEISDNLREGQLLVFAHGASVHFGAVVPPADVDVVLIAPLGPGKRLQELYKKTPGVACFFGVQQDYTGQAQQTGLAVAKAIGCLFSGAFQTTFAEEAVGDLFGEQAVLCGGFARLLKLGFDTLVDNGLAPEKAYLECVHQIDLIVDLIKSGGIAGMLTRISRTAAWGALQNGPRAIGDAVRADFEDVYRAVESGSFYAELLERQVSDQSDSSALTDKRFEQAARRVRELLTDSGEGGDKT